MNQLSNQIIENKKIILSNQEMNYLGHQLVLKNCEIIIETSAKGLVVADVQFIDSKIKVKKTLNNFRWHSADFIDCVFEGKFKGNDFGKRDFSIAQRGLLRNCDFTTSTLDGCRFFECEVNSLKLPAWPCFWVQKPFEKIKWLREVENGILSELAEIYEDDGLKPEMIVDYAPALSKVLGVDIGILKRLFDK